MGVQFLGGAINVKISKFSRNRIISPTIFKFTYMQTEDQSNKYNLRFLYLNIENWVQKWGKTYLKKTHLGKRNKHKVVMAFDKNQATVDKYFVKSWKHLSILKDI